VRQEFHTPDVLPRIEILRTHFMLGSVGPKAGLNTVVRMSTSPCWQSNHYSLIVQTIA